jgi:hypothetical protein
MTMISDRLRACPGRRFSHAVHARVRIALAARRRRQRASVRVFAPKPMTMEDLATLVAALRHEKQLLDDVIDWNVGILRAQLAETGQKSKTLRNADGSGVHIQVYDGATFLCTEHHVAPSLCRDGHIGPIEVEEVPMPGYLAVRPLAGSLR